MHNSTVEKNHEEENTRHEPARRRNGRIDAATPEELKPLYQRFNNRFRGFQLRKMPHAR